MSAATGDLAPAIPPEPADVSLSIVVVTWNCSDLALRCLHEIGASEIGRDYELIVVDNASTDGTASRIASAYPHARVVANAANEGFARANNQGIALARGRYLLLLNPDAFPTGPHTFAALLRAMDADPGIAALGCRLVHADGRHQVGDAGWRPSPVNVAIHGFGLSSVLSGIFPGGRGLFLVRPPADTPDRPPIDVDWICGACLLLRTQAIRRYGGFDERFFMYAEDVELGCRLRGHGLRVGYLPGETVLHLQGGTKAGDEISTVWLDSLGRLYRTTNAGRHWFTFRAALGIGFMLRAAIYRLMAIRKGRDLHRRAVEMATYARHVWHLRQL